LGWEDPLAREDPLRCRASRWAQRVVGLATDRLLVKRDGREAEASPLCRGADHEEAEAQEGQVGRQKINRRLVTQTDSHEVEGPEGDKRRWLSHPRQQPPCLQESPPRNGDERNLREQRQEGMPAATSRRDFVGGSNPCRANPTDATRLKMAGRRREEEGRREAGKA